MSNFTRKTEINSSNNLQERKKQEDNSMNNYKYMRIVPERASLLSSLNAHHFLSYTSQE